MFLSKIHIHVSPIFKFRYLFIDIFILRRDISSALIEITAIEIQISALTFQYKCLENIITVLLQFRYSHFSINRASTEN